MKRRYLVLLTIFSLVFSVYLAFAPPVMLHNVYFYISKVPIGAEESQFKRGETVYVVARPPIQGASIDFEVLLFFPPESGRSPLILLSRTRIVLTSERTIAKYDIAETDFTGKYAIRIRVWDPATGKLEEGDLPFEVVEEFPLMWIVVPAVVILATVGAVVLLRRKPSPTSQQPPLAPQVPLLESPTQVRPSTATVSVLTPSGDTLRLIAMLEFGDRFIPITSVPARFGREDFAGLLPPNMLSLISRRMPRGQFTIDYDYISGSFVIIDEWSTNGTFVNGVDIRGKGRVPLKDGDIISPANAFNLRFTVKLA